MIISTTSTLQNAEIVDYLGVVTGEAIMGANIVRDIFASVTDIIGGRSGVYEKKLGQGRQIAIDEMTIQARQLGADAIIGVDLDFETVQQGMLMCVATGTAVKLKR
jgi:uncharacterized protein YbjQ (UPF0145 family)